MNGEPTIRTASLSGPDPEALPHRPLRVGVLVDLALTPDAGGQAKCWQRLAEAAVDQGDGLDLTVHFSGPAPRRIVLSPSVRYELLPPVLSTARLISGVPDHTDVAPWHPKLARALRAYDVIHTTDAFFCYAQTAMRFARRHGIPLVSSVHTNTPEYARITTARLLERVLGSGAAMAPGYRGGGRRPSWRRPCSGWSLPVFAAHRRAACAMISMPPAAILRTRCNSPPPASCGCPPSRAATRTTTPRMRWPPLLSTGCRSGNSRPIISPAPGFARTALPIGAAASTRSAPRPARPR